MDSKKVYDFLFQLFDYADYIGNEIHPTNPDNQNYYISLIYIEEMMDSYGRGLIKKCSYEVSPENDKGLEEAHRRIGLLRQKIISLRDEYGFETVIQSKTQKLLRDWAIHS